MVGEERFAVLVGVIPLEINEKVPNNIWRGHCTGLCTCHPPLADLRIALLASLLLPVCWALKPVQRGLCRVTMDPRCCCALYSERHSGNIISAHGPRALYFHTPKVTFDQQ
jgi:hypothetical protein